MPIGPFVAGPQFEGKLPVFLDFDREQDIRFDPELFVIADQPGIAVNHEQADVLGAADQSAHFTALLADYPLAGEACDGRFDRQPRPDRR